MVYFEDLLNVRVIDQENLTFKLEKKKKVNMLENLEWGNKGKWCRKYSRLLNNIRYREMLKDGSWWFTSFLLLYVWESVKKCFKEMDCSIDRPTEKKDAVNECSCKWTISAWVLDV